jgi:chromosome segregation ATPase
MKALWLREVQAILERKDFLEWWQSLLDLEQKLAAVNSRYDELLAQVNLMDFRAEFTQKNAIDSLYLAGEYEDTAAQLLAEAAEIENKSYEAVANFESQRISVSDLFSRMGAVEHHFLSLQAETRSLKTTMEGAREREKRDELDRVLKRKESEIARLERELRESSAVYERENSRKMSLWEEVEQMWTRSLSINLGVSERRVKSKRARREAERLFREAEQHKQKAQALRVESEEAKKKTEELQRSIEDLRSSARRLFGCLVGEEFLYWPRRENVNEVYCAPINDHAEGFNIELRARNIYLINRQRGVEFIEPLPPEGEIQQEEDRRIDNFFRTEKPEAASGPEGS